MNEAAYLAGLTGEPEQPPADDLQARIEYRLAYARGDIHRRILRAIRLLEEAKS